MRTSSGLTVPSVACCKNDQQRRALSFNNRADAREYHLSLLRNGTDALLCEEQNGAACVCEVRVPSPEATIAWARGSEVRCGDTEE